MRQNHVKDVSFVGDNQVIEIEVTVVDKSNGQSDKFKKENGTLTYTEVSVPP